MGFLFSIIFFPFIIIIIIIIINERGCFACQAYMESATALSDESKNISSK